jgi:hypothetical protein
VDLLTSTLQNDRKSAIPDGGKLFGDVPMNLDYGLSVEDSPNSAVWLSMQSAAASWLLIRVLVAFCMLLLHISVSILLVRFLMMMPSKELKNL